MTSTSRLTIDQVVAPVGPPRQMDQEAAVADAWRRTFTAGIVATALFYGLPAIGANRAVTMLAVQMAIVAFGHCQMIVFQRQTRERILIEMRRYWHWDLSEADLSALELRLSHLRRPFDRSGLLATITMPALALMAILANGLQSVGVWNAPAWTLESATWLVALATVALLRRWEFQIEDRMAKPTCIRPT